MSIFLQSVAWWNPCACQHQPALAADLSCLQSENGSSGQPDYADIIDPMTFEQILEMDDDEEERDFSKGIVYGFFEQAETTFKKMEVFL